MKKKRKNAGVIRLKTQQQTRNYFKELNTIFKLQNGFISSEQQVSLAKQFSCAWNTIKIAIGLGYIERTHRGKYRNFKPLNDEQIINVVRTKNKISQGIIKLKDVQVDKSMQLKLPLSTTKVPKQPNTRSRPTKYEDLTAYEKDYYIKLRFALHKEYNVNLEEVHSCFVLVVNFYHSLTPIQDAVIHIGAKNGLQSIKKGGVKEPKQSENTEVNHPTYYNDGNIEVIEFIEDKKMNFNLGNAIKYISRAGKKDETKTKQDLEKAQWYINREINNLKNK